MLPGVIKSRAFFMGMFSCNTMRISQFICIRDWLGVLTWFFSCYLFKIVVNLFGSNFLCLVYSSVCCFHSTLVKDCVSLFLFIFCKCIAEAILHCSTPLHHDLANSERCGLSESMSVLTVTSKQSIVYECATQQNN